MKKLPLLFILLPFLIFSQSSAKYPTLLWKISGNGLKKPSYLYGTMHVSNRVAYYLSEQFFDALKSVEVVGLETNPAEWLENMEKTGELSELSQIRSPGFNGNFYKTAFNVAFPERRMLQGILSYDPDIINGLLYRQNKTRENFEESTYIDLFIFQSASKLNKKVISLENFTESEILSRLSALPDDEQEGGNRNTAFFTAAQKIEDAYREGNLDLIDSLSKISSSGNMQKYLIVARNHLFAETIDSVLKRSTMFSGVGAAHLPGDEGVIRLLREKGYRVEPVFPEVTKKSNALREKLDQSGKDVKFSKQFASDSLFSVNLPGKLYTIVNLGHLRYDIHADMVNGSFYTIVRLKHFAPLFNLTKEQLMQRIDSLLFENIPGKIVSKKNISAQGGIQGIEVVNRMRRGDEQHYQIFFTDLEMIMFKLGGKGAYASGPEARLFFGSIQFRQRPGTDVRFSPPAKGFSVTIPGEFSYSKNDGVSVAGVVEDLYAFDRSAQASFGIKRAIYNDFNYLEEDTFELQQLAKNVLLNFNYKVSPGYTLVPFTGLPSISFKGTNAAGHYLSGRIVIRGVHYYLQYQVYRSPSAFRQDYFNSFALNDFVSLHPLKKITDNEFYFSAVDEVTDDALSRFNEAYQKAYDKIKKVINDTTKTDADYREGTKLYYSPSSNEYVFISFEKYNNYDYRDPATIEKRITESFRYATSLIIAKKAEKREKDLTKFHYHLKDTATSRAIDVRVIFKSGIMLEISAPFDTTIGLRGWAKGFMESFAPLDTVVGRNIFENKFSDLLNDLTTGDTVRRQSADNALKTSVSLQKPYLDEFIGFITSPRIHEASEDSRAQLFVNGGTLESNRIILPYRELYKQYTDSFYLQLCLLKGLALLKTEESYNAFKELLLKEAPLVGDENSISDVFSALHDSIRLCRDFFPALLTLTRYDEYRNPVYSLLAAMVDDKVIGPARYAGQKENILMDASLALKRYSPAVKNTPQSSALEHLDRNSRELAENILGNLDGLANNNMYHNSGYLKALDAGRRSPLVNYATVLNPFYHADNRVREFIGKLAKVKAQEINMPLTISMLKNKIRLSDTLVEYYSSNKFTRAFFYSELEKESLQGAFSKEYLSQKSLIESVLSSQKQLAGIYNNDKDRLRRDSLTLVTVVEGRNKYQAGKIYIFRNATGRNEDEQWSAVFINGHDDKVSSRIEIITGTFYVDKSLSQQENINQLISQFNLSYRKRALANNNSYE
jgi:uncharacterized protein YbaP (TraB family)